MLKASDHMTPPPGPDVSRFPRRAKVTEREVSNDEANRREREQGFNVLFSGANEDRVKEQIRRDREQRLTSANGRGRRRQLDPSINGVPSSPWPVPRTVGRSASASPDDDENYTSALGAMAAAMDSRTDISGSGRSRAKWVKDNPVYIKTENGARIQLSPKKSRPSVGTSSSGTFQGDKGSSRGDLTGPGPVAVMIGGGTSSDENPDGGEGSSEDFEMDILNYLEGREEGAFRMDAASPALVPSGRASSLSSRINSSETETDVTKQIEAAIQGDSELALNEQDIEFLRFMREARDGAAVDSGASKDWRRGRSRETSPVKGLVDKGKSVDYIDEGLPASLSDSDGSRDASPPKNAALGRPSQSRRMNAPITISEPITARRVRPLSATRAKKLVTVPHDHPNEAASVLLAIQAENRSAAAASLSGRSSSSAPRSEQMNSSGYMIRESPPETGRRSSTKSSTSAGSIGFGDIGIGSNTNSMKEDVHSDGGSVKSVSSISDDDHLQYLDLKHPSHHIAGEPRPQYTSLDTTSSNSRLMAAENPPSPSSPALPVQLEERVRQLDPKKQRYLMRVLDRLDKADSMGMNVSTIIDKLDLTAKERKDGGAVALPPYELVLRIRSSWGDPNYAGLTEVEMFDGDGYQWPINPHQVQLRGMSVQNSVIGRIVNGKAKTSNVNDMWLGVLPKGSQRVEVLFNIPGGKSISKLRIWNYNRTPSDSDKGVKELDVVMDQKVVWSGVLQKGSDGPTNIILAPARSHQNGVTFSSPAALQSILDAEEVRAALPPSQGPSVSPSPSPSLSMMRSASNPNTSAFPLAPVVLSGSASAPTLPYPPPPKTAGPRETPRVLPGKAPSAAAFKASASAAAPAPISSSTTSTSTATKPAVSLPAFPSAASASAPQKAAQKAVAPALRSKAAPSPSPSPSPALVDTSSATLPPKSPFRPIEGASVSASASASPVVPPLPVPSPAPGPAPGSSTSRQPQLSPRSIIQSSPRSESHAPDQTLAEARLALKTQSGKPKDVSPPTTTATATASGSASGAGPGQSQSRAEFIRDLVAQGVPEWIAVLRSGQEQTTKRPDDLVLKADEQAKIDLSFLPSTLDDLSETMHPRPIVSRNRARDSMGPKWSSGSVGLGGLGDEEVAGTVPSASSATRPPSSDGTGAPTPAPSPAPVPAPAPTSPVDKKDPSMSGPRRSVVGGVAGAPVPRSAASSPSPTTIPVPDNEVLGMLGLSDPAPAPAANAPPSDEPDSSSVAPSSSTSPSPPPLVRPPPSRSSRRSMLPPPVDVLAPPTSSAETSPDSSTENTDPYLPKARDSRPSKQNPFGLPVLEEGDSSAMGEGEGDDDNNGPDVDDTASSPTGTVDSAPPAYIPSERPARRKRTVLDESWDSLAFFQSNHAGRMGRGKYVEPTASEMSAATGTGGGAGNGNGNGGASAAPQAMPDLQLPPLPTDEFAALTFSLAKPPVAAPPPAPLPKPASAAAAAAAASTAPAPVVLPSPSPAEDVVPMQFIIPRLPTGKSLVINILSSWGDPYYVGLSAIEVFDSTGAPVTLKDVKKQLRADPPDVNVLQGYGKDPRTVDKLVDGVNCTCDDVHVWLAPFTKSRSHFIFIDLNEVTTLGMLRFWNYNKSRIHAARGAREVEITLDRRLIFKGELQKAPGTLSGAERSAEAILFTEDEECVSSIERHYQGIRAAEEELAAMQQQLDMRSIERPRTANKSLGADGRPMTAAYHPRNPAVPAPAPASAAAPARGASAKPKAAQHPVPPPQPLVVVGAASSVKPAGKTAASGPGPAPASSSSSTSSRSSVSTASHDTAASSPDTNPSGRYLKMEFLSTWGDAYYMGLTAVEIIDSAGKAVPLSLSSLDAKPRDLNEIPGHTGDDRTLDKLIDGCNLTCDDKHMWLIPFTANQQHYLQIDMALVRSIKAVRIWNYNKSVDDSSRGAKFVRFHIDNKLISPQQGHLLRKAPGADNVEYGQYIQLYSTPPASQAAFVVPKDNDQLRPNRRRSHNDLVRQDYETPYLPTGYMFKLVLQSTWGDPYYVGLCGVGIYDQSGAGVRIDPRIVSAVPMASINGLPGITNDVRTPDKLVDGTNDTWNDEHMWLAPFAAGQNNIIYIAFDEPVTMSLFTIWNYSKTPSRGAQDVELFVDDLLVFKGILKRAPDYKVGMEGKFRFPQSILFTDDQRIVNREKANVYCSGDADPVVLLFNDNRRLTPALPDNPTTDNANSRPSTSVVGSRQPLLGH